MSDHIFCPISGETDKEELLNFWTHLIGLLFSMIGFVILVYYSLSSGGTISLTSSAVYGTSLVLLFASSTFYHGCKTVEHKRILKICDHICIYLLIAGSYTPFALGPLREHGGMPLLWVEWAIAAAGIVFKIVAIDRFQIFSTIAYLAMGWLIALIFSSLLETIPPSAFALLVGGGVSYTLGTIFYAWDSLPYNHGIWHLFVLGGSVSHYFSILEIVDFG